jgi:hypothetical protein
MAWCDIMCLPRALNFAGLRSVGGRTDAADLAKLLVRFSSVAAIKGLAQEMIRRLNYFIREVPCDVRFPGRRLKN